MKIKKGLFTTVIEIQAGELTEFLHREEKTLFWGLMRWLDKYLDFSIRKPKLNK